MPDRNEANPLKDVQNILGFLLAGFGGIVGFLGLRSTEVTTVLRNDSFRASLIALILLLAVLAAVLSVTIPNYKKVPLWRVVAIFFLLLGIGALTVFAIPIGVPIASNAKRVLLSLGVGILLVGIAIYVWARWKTLPRMHQSISMRLTFILASVTLLAISVYGAMRLEVKSQGASSVQISANVATKTPNTTLSVHVTGFKVKAGEYVGITISGLPTSVLTETQCSAEADDPKFNMGDRNAFIANCMQDPCQFLRGQCRVIIGAAFPPDASGNISETLSDGLVPSEFQDISVKAVVCLPGSCTFNTGISPVSHLDIHLSNLPVT
jgi:hypothetical protein